MMKRARTTTMASRYNNASYYATTILLLLATTGFQLASANTLQPRIVGGQDADFGEYPFFTSWSTSCGATLIHDDMLLTAAHCNPVTTKQVIVGAYAKSTPMINSELREIQRRIIHPEYNVDTWNYDVMLLKLKDPVTNIEKVKINADPNLPAVRDSVTPLGLGRMQEVNGNFPTFLQEVNVRVIDNNICNAAPMYPGWIQDTMVCAGVPQGGQDACFGDSGGPLLQKNFTSGEVTQVGIVSFGTGCARADKPGVYHRTSASYDWIQEQICEHSDFPPDSCNQETTTAAATTKVVVVGSSSQPQQQQSPPQTTSSQSQPQQPAQAQTQSPPEPEPEPESEPEPEPEPVVEENPTLFTYPANPPPLALGECEGDCDRDSDCAPGLFCFYKTNGVAVNVPGCEGSDTTSTDFCVDIKYKNAATSSSTSPIRQSLFSQKQSLRGTSKRMNSTQGTSGGQKMNGMLMGIFQQRMVP